MSNLIPSFGGVFDSNMDNLFRNLMDYRPVFSSNRLSASPSCNVPLANIASTEEGYTIELAVPGFSRDDFQINVENNAMTVTGTAYSSSDEMENENYTNREFSCSSFSRSWKLPEGVSAEHVTANYEAGILTIGVPVEGTQKKKYTIAVD